MLRSPGSPALVLVPTELELSHLSELGGIPPGLGLTERCGFGLVAAAARSAELLARLRPRRVLLLGIAGSYDLEECPLAAAACFSTVALDGIGIGSGRSFVALSGVAWPSGRPPEPVPAALLPLAGGGRRALLSVAAASASPAEAGERRQRHPDAQAEDMEGFAVAFACERAGVPLTIVRGISNATGVRDSREWRVREALAAARDLALERLELEDGGTA